MHKMVLAHLFLGLVCLANARSVSAHGIEVIVDVDASNKLTVDFSGNPIYAGGVPVYADHEFKLSPVLGNADIPSMDTSLAAASTLGLKVLHPLFVWTPADGLNAATSATISAQSLYYVGEQAVISKTSIAATSSFAEPNTFEITQANDPQLVGIHHILNWQRSTGAPTAAYGLLVELVTLAGDSHGPSDPFLIVLNNGLTNGFDLGLPADDYSDDAQVPLDGSQFGAAVDAMTRAAFPVPEPSTLVLLGMGAGGLALLGWRRRAGRNAR